MQQQQRSQVYDSASVQQLVALMHRVVACPTLGETLQAVADSVVEAVGFRHATVSILDADQSLRAVAVASSDPAARAQLGQTIPAGFVDEIFDVGERWGDLVFVPHPTRLTTHRDPYRPAISVSDDPAAWHPDDMLHAPLRSSSGKLIGMLRVDEPADGRRPGPAQREMLMMFAHQAGVAIDKAQLAEQLTNSELALGLVFQHARTGQLLIPLHRDASRTQIRANAALCEMFGYTEAEFQQMTWDDMTGLQDPITFDAKEVFAQLARHGGQHETERRYVRKDGTHFWARCTKTVEYASDPSQKYAVASVTDVSHSRAETHRLQRLASHDPLTGVANRRTMDALLSDLCASVRKSGGQGAVLFCDLDGFKFINDAFGHDAGDKALITISSRMELVIAPDQHLARPGGDEFVVIAEDITMEEAQDLATRLMEAVGEPISLAGSVVKVSISIGIALATPSTPDGPTLLREADASMYACKVGRSALTTQGDGSVI